MLQALKVKLDHNRTIRQLQRYWLTVAFLGGFLLDNITLNNVEQTFDNIILATYVILSMVALTVLYAGSAGKLPFGLNGFARSYAPLFVQFAFGGLLSGMLIFYGRSGAWVQSWPFLLIILAVILGNETIRDRAGRLVFNFAILFVGLFSYVVLMVPVFTGVMGPWVFVGSGLIALLILYIFLQVLFHVIPNFLSLHMRSIVFTIGVLYCSLNVLYFTNIIPPIPLSLKDAGIYHSVIRFNNGDYELKYEDGAWWQPFKDSDRTYHPTVGGAVFCFAQVFAPTKLQTQIVHVWEYHDEVSGSWREHARISYSIAGGRDGGYRGYTQISNTRAGKWRCSVETERGQVLGREVFWVDPTRPVGTLVTRIE